MGDPPVRQPRGRSRAASLLQAHRGRGEVVEEVGDEGVREDRDHVDQAQTVPGGREGMGVQGREGEDLVDHQRTRRRTGVEGGHGDVNRGGGDRGDQNRQSLHGHDGHGARSLAVVGH